MVMAPDETKVETGIEPTGSPSTSPKETSTKTDAVTLTPQELEKRINKGKSDALAEAGRTTKQLDTRQEKLEADQKKLDTEREALRKKTEAAEDVAAREDPDAFKSLAERREITRQREKLQEDGEALDIRKRELEEQETNQRGATREVNARSVAAELHVSEETLAKFGGDTLESMKELAKSLPKTDGTSPETKPALKTDSGKTAGEVHTSDSAMSKMRSGFDKLHVE